MKFEKLADDLMHNMEAMKNGSPADGIGRFRKGSLFLLHIICHCKNHKNISPKEISEAMGTSSARTASLLSKLESKGLIERQMDAVDRRRIQVQITKEGKKKIQNMHHQMKQEVARVLEKMGENDAQEFVRLQGDFVRYLNESGKFTGKKMGI
ncbi:MAG: MarR family transcriptional regulator [Clostridiales Family XIII bacterium]|jgi:DNA-binding MarR family transcriptional regulator|nr:MarR family transcriptional regulator [Clostridiales Family XIII bacterium]